VLRLGSRLFRPLWDGSWIGIQFDGFVLMEGTRRLPRRITSPLRIPVSFPSRISTTTTNSTDTRQSSWVRPLSLQLSLL
jgi:hypothetical protein